MLEKTPFQWLVKLQKPLEICCPLLREMVTRWSNGAASFRIREHYVPFTPVDIWATEHVSLKTNVMSCTFPRFKALEDVIATHILKPNVELQQDNVGAMVVAILQLPWLTPKVILFATAFMMFDQMERNDGSIT
ncbi:hypothetical protein VNO78_01979 [Psophocarpus tetragonolobus]|uniref:Uncharacterized protein n=1 Tax=Psophocarpus tetragonolobus TaxID=3891 RepID=A0AAN9XUW0_PSOTE